MAEKHGFGLAGFRSNGRQEKDENIQAVKKAAA
jgi:hypothetical protein